MSQLVTMSETARTLDVHHQSLRYYFAQGKLSGERSGGIILMDPERVKKELEAAGFYRRRENRRRGHARGSS